MKSDKIATSNSRPTWFFWPPLKPEQVGVGGAAVPTLPPPSLEPRPKPRRFSRVTRISADPPGWSSFIHVSSVSRFPPPTPPTRPSAGLLRPSSARHRPPQSSHAEAAARLHCWRQVAKDTSAGWESSSREPSCYKMGRDERRDGVDAGFFSVVLPYHPPEPQPHPAHLLPP